MKNFEIVFNKNGLMKEIEDVLIKDEVNPKRPRGRPKKYQTQEEFAQMKKEYMQRLKEIGYFRQYYRNRKMLLNQPEIYEFDINL